MIIDVFCLAHRSYDVHAVSLIYTLKTNEPMLLFWRYLSSLNAIQNTTHNNWSASGNMELRVMVMTFKMQKVLEECSLLPDVVW